MIFSLNYTRDAVRPARELIKSLHGIADISSIIYIGTDIIYPDKDVLFDDELIPIRYPTPELYHDLCIMCGNCSQDCIYGAIKTDKDKNIHSIDYNKCTSCGLCIEKCPEGALHSDFRKKAIIKKYCNTNKLNVFEFETIENISNYKILSDKLRNILNNIEGNAIIVFNYHPELYALLSSKTIGSIFLINKLIPPILKELNRINRSFEKLSILISSTNEHSRDINIDSFSKLLSANEPSDTLAKNIFEIFTGPGCISQ